MFKEDAMITRSELETWHRDTAANWKVILTLAALLQVDHTEPANKVGSVASTVLIIGNEVEVSHLRAALEEGDVRAETATHMAEAMETLSSYDFHLVIIDESYLDSSSSCWKLRRGKNTLIILMGSNPDKEGWERAVNLEADAYLPKCLGRAEKVARVKAILRRYGEA